MQNMYECWFLNTFKNPKNFKFCNLSTNNINKINKYKRIPQRASGIPKNCEYDVFATLSQSNESFIAQMLGAADCAKLA